MILVFFSGAIGSIAGTETGKKWHEFYVTAQKKLEQAGHVVVTRGIFTNQDIVQGYRAEKTPNIHTLTCNRVKSCDFLIADVTIPSHGIGVEIQKYHDESTRRGLRRRALLFFNVKQSTRHLSYVLAHNPLNCVYYYDCFQTCVNDLLQNMKRVLAQWSPKNPLQIDSKYFYERVKVINENARKNHSVRKRFNVS